MIDFIKLSEHRQAFGLYARLLAYPDHRMDWSIEQDGDFSPSASEWIQKFREKTEKFDLDELQELYVQTFDFQKGTNLYMTYAKFEDGKERGPMLANLKLIYEMNGLEIMDNELPDYLPLMCEFLHAADWSAHSQMKESMNLLLAVMEDGTYKLLKELEKAASPYYNVVKAIRETFKLCLLQEVVNHD